MGQGLVAGLESGNLIETHAIWSTGPFTVKALYAAWDIDGSAVEAAGADKQKGFYLEPSYRLSEKFGVFARFNQWITRLEATQGLLKIPKKSNGILV